MTRCRLSSRWAAWAFALALLLKAAVPLLAAGSAHAQGKALAEVCTVYGVATVALDGAESTPASDHSAPHAGDHCALGAVVALAVPAPDAAAAAPAVTADEGAARPNLLASAGAQDACAAWVARLHHGPPALADTSAC